MTSSDVWTAEQAQRFDRSDGVFSPEVVGPVVDALAAWAAEGPALEFAIGTGRIAVPLLSKGVAVSGIELSRPMVEQLRTKVSESQVPVVLRDMATTRVPGEFSVVYLVFNTIGNPRTPAEQVECFRNAARHLPPGGRFVVEVGVPPVRQLVPGQTAVAFDVGDEHLGVDILNPVTQEATSHHLFLQSDGTYRRGTHNFRYVWPSELDLMAQLAGMELEQRTDDRTGTPFGRESSSHVSVFRRPDR